MKIGPLTPNDATLSELGDRLTQVRKQRGLSQQALAESAGIGVATLRRIEDGRDSKLGSWICVLRALDMSSALDALLPENFRSPLSDAKRQRRRGKANANKSGFVWGDERK